MNEYDIAKEMLDKWKAHDIAYGFYKGIPNYPTNVGFIKALQEEAAKTQEQIILNSLAGKQTRTNGKEILEKTLTRFVVGTDYTAQELIEIMQTKKS